MDLRNIRRWYLFNRAIKRYPVTTQQLNVLYSIYYLQSCGSHQLFNFLRRNNRGAGTKDLASRLSELLSLGYTEYNNKRYSVSPIGLSLLYDIEDTARKLRPDR